MSAAEGTSKASSVEQANEWAEQANGANGQASGLALTSGFLVIPDHSAAKKTFFRQKITRTFLVIPQHGPQNVHFGSMFIQLYGHVANGGTDRLADGWTNGQTYGR